MANLKDLKARISSVKSTQKITSAMKMVAAAKLRRAQDMAIEARPYANKLHDLIYGMAVATKKAGTAAPAMLTGTGSHDKHLLVLCTADRGLCGGFNGSLVKETRIMVNALRSEGKQVKVLCAGKKGRDLLKRELGDDIVATFEGLDKPKLDFSKADEVADKIKILFDDGTFDVCTLIFARFRSAISQEVTRQQIIPYVGEVTGEAVGGEATEKDLAADVAYDFEPSEEVILKELLPHNVGIQVYQALLESLASEMGARMTAMDNATRNAGDMIGRLTLLYNRTRQAQITKELIEIVSGAEAL